MRKRALWCSGVGLALLLECLTLPSRALARAGCPGDCDGNGTVTASEVVVMVNIALGNGQVGGCPAGDANADGQITVDEIVLAASNALGNCDGAPLSPHDLTCSNGTIAVSVAGAGGGEGDLDIGSVAGLPGDTVLLPVILNTMGQPIAGVQNNIIFDSRNTPITADIHGAPVCSVNPTINKAATSFAFLPAGCRGAACTGISAIVFALDNVDPIPDGSVLYTCNVNIAAGASQGQYPLLCSNVISVLVTGPTATPATPTPATATPTRTYTLAPTATKTPIMTPTKTASSTPTRTRTASPTITPTFTPTRTPTVTPTRTNTATPTVTRTPTPTPILPCVGDCVFNGQVTVDKLLTMVNVALGHASVETCLAGDANHDRQITVDEILAAVNNALNGCGPQAGDFVHQGLTAVAAGDLSSASQLFCQAAVTMPHDDRAQLYCSVASLITRTVDDAFSNPSVRSLLQRGGVTIAGSSHNVCGIHVTLPSDVPVGAPRTGEILNTLDAVLLPEIDQAVISLQGLPDTLQVLIDPGNFPYCLRGKSRPRDVEIDHGDVLTFLAALQTARAGLDILSAYDIDVDLLTLTNHTAQTILADAPNLFTLVSAAPLGPARQEFADALVNFGLAITSILAETDDQSNDLLVIAPEDREDAQRTVRILDLIRQSLQGEVVLPSDVGLSQPARLNLSLFFSGLFTTLRPFLPAFDARGGFDLSNFPHPTFGGVAPDLTQQDIDSAIPQIERFIRYFGRRDCTHQLFAPNEAACISFEVDYRCTSEYFYALYGVCYVSGCLCGV